MVPGRRYPRASDINNEKIMEYVDVVVIGAGVVGLAIARKFALEGREVVILEAEDSFGTQTSSRNSEVIHAGIYYPSGSLKAKLCVAGREMLYAYCAQHNVVHKKIGKLIVAVEDEELGELRSYFEKAKKNGVRDLNFVDASTMREIEPAVRGIGGLLSPSTGIVDSHGLMLAYLGDAQANGAWLALKSPVLGGCVGPDGIMLEVGGEEPLQIKARLVINSAGLQAQSVARSIYGIPADSIPKEHFARGHYFALSGKSPFNRLVYPIANSAGLGVHVTLDLAGGAKFGPDVSDWGDKIDYAFNETRRAYFESAIRRYWPDLDSQRLIPGYVGIRPKVSGPHDPAADFVIQEPADSGVASWIALYGIESPGLTSSMAIANHVWDLSRKH